MKNMQNFITNRVQKPNRTKNKEKKEIILKKTDEGEWIYPEKTEQQ